MFENIRRKETKSFPNLPLEVPEIIIDFSELFGREIISSSPEDAQLKQDAVESKLLDRAGLKELFEIEHTITQEATKVFKKLYNLPQVNSDSSLKKKLWKLIQPDFEIVFEELPIKLKELQRSEVIAALSEFTIFLQANEERNKAHRDKTQQLDQASEALRKEQTQLRFERFYWQYFSLRGYYVALLEEIKSASQMNKNGYLDADTAGHIEADLVSAETELKIKAFRRARDENMRPHVKAREFLMHDLGRAEATLKQTEEPIQKNILQENIQKYTQDLVRENQIISIIEAMRDLANFSRILLMSLEYYEEKNPNGAKLRGVAQECPQACESYDLKWRTYFSLFGIDLLQELMRTKSLLDGLNPDETQSIFGAQQSKETALLLFFSDTYRKGSLMERAVPRASLVQKVLHKILGYKYTEAKALAPKILSLFQDESIIPNNWLLICRDFNFNLFITIDFLRQVAEKEIPPLDLSQLSSSQYLEQMKKMTSQEIGTMRVYDPQDIKNRDKLYGKAELNPDSWLPNIDKLEKANESTAKFVQKRPGFAAAIDDLDLTSLE